MNELGVMLVWCALQVTILVAAALGLSYLLSRWSLRVSRTVVSIGAALVLLLSLLAWSPWPRWSALPTIPVDLSPSPTTDASLRASAVDNSAAPSAADPTLSAQTTPASNDSTWRSFVQEFSTGMRLAAARNRSQWSWTGILAGLFILLALLGVFQLLVGAIAVHRLRVRARPVKDPAAHALINELRRRMQIGTVVEVLESDELTIAATVGWRRPAILISPGWAHWTPLELRLVLAHELAHIRNNDFLWFVCAKAGLALHLYHPLVHWLVGRLQLDLELVADASAAAIADNPAHYLRTLADMALRQSDRRLGWSARTFLPTRGSLIRRLEMLKNTPSLRCQPAAGLRLSAGGLLLAVGILAAGMRGAVGADPPANQAATNTPAAALNSSDWIPADVMALFVVRPADLLAQKSIGEAMRIPMTEAIKRFAVSPDKVAQWTALFSPPTEKGTPPRDSGFILRLKAPEKIAPTIPKGATTSTKQFLGTTYTSIGDVAWAQVDPQTVLVAAEEDLKRLIANGREAKSPLVKSKQWQAVRNQSVIAAADMRAVSQALDLAGAPPAAQALLAPLWSDAAEIYLAGDCAGGLKLVGMIQGRDGAGLQKTKDTLSAAQTLGQNMLTGIRGQIQREPAGQRALIVTFLDIADELLKSLRIEEQAGNALTANASAQFNAERSAALQQAVVEARSAAQRSVGMNCVKQILLALHIYRDVHGHFPPAVVKGKDNKGGVPHSWRIEILPYLEQSALYEVYKFDEPWDSESNRKLLDKMPPVFRAPEDKPDSVNASYFAVVGPGTLFSNPEGAKVESITDGLSNTIALIEAKQDVPWTKPVDLEFLPDKPLPKLGGWRDAGFIVGISDGAVRFFTKAIDEKRLRAMLSIAGGEIVEPID